MKKKHINLKQPKSKERHQENPNYCLNQKQNAAKSTKNQTRILPKCPQSTPKMLSILPKRSLSAPKAHSMPQYCSKYAPRAPKMAPRPSKSTPKVPAESPRRSQNVQSASFQHSMLGASISKRPQTHFEFILAFILIIPASPNFFKNIVFSWFFQCFEQQP